MEFNSEILLPLVRHHTVGLLNLSDDAATVIGTAVLVSIAGRCGLLTCTHVADVYEQMTEIGIVRFDRELERQMQRLSLGDTHTVKLGGPPWNDDPLRFDIAFTQLAPDQAGTLQSTSHFLDLHRNLHKFRSEPDCPHIDALFGLVDQFTGVPVHAAGLITTPLRVVLTPGGVRARESGTMTFVPMDTENPEFPKSFGGNSGGGLWRAYFTVKNGRPRVVDARLCGVSSYQTPGKYEIICQGVERLAMLAQQVVGPTR